MSGIIHQKQDPNAIRATGTLEKRSPGDQAVQVLLYVLIALIALLCVLPFIYVIAGSFATEQELTERPFFLIPHEFSLNAYSYILKDGSVFRGLKNSFLVTIVGTLINMFVSCTLAYPLSRSYLKGRNGFINMVIVTMLFSGGMVPSYILVMNILDLGNTFWALWLPGAMSAFNMIIIKNYFQGLPNELEEAAIIDGCAHHPAAVHPRAGIRRAVLRGRSLELLLQRHDVHQRPRHGTDDHRAAPHGVPDQQDHSGQHLRLGRCRYAARQIHQDGHHRRGHGPDALHLPLRSEVLHPGHHGRLREGLIPVIRFHHAVCVL